MVVFMWISVVLTRIFHMYFQNTTL